MSKGKGKLLARGCFKVRNELAERVGNDATRFYVDILKKEVDEVPYQTMVLEMDRVRDGFVFTWELRA